MKRLLFFIVIAVSFFSCNTPVSETHQCVAPLPSGLQIDNLTDCTIAASFNIDNFDWMGGNLEMEIFSKDIYDAVEISQLKIGDTLIYDGKRIIVDSISEDGNTLIINKGLEEGGAWLQAYEGGTYKAIQFDDHAMYSSLGKAQVPLAEDFIFIDCGDNPTDPIDTIKTSQKLHIEQLEGYKQNFSFLNTLVVIEEGFITEINRRWIP